MFLDFRSLNVKGSVESLLGIRSMHVRASPLFLLDRVPGVFSCTCGNHAKAGCIGTVESNVASHELVAKDPFIKGR